MTLDEFAHSARFDPAPPAALGRPLQALWWDRRGDWNRAHAAVMADERGVESAWAHAYLHRREGDDGNAHYWYRRAGRPAATGPLDAEWVAIASALLRG